MRNILSCTLFLLILTVSAVVADEISISRTSLLDFPHKRHQKSLGGCTDCHGAKEPGPIAQFGEKWAHDTCAKCHTESQSGPSECNGCHTNIY